jgi:hypothetical protein
MLKLMLGTAAVTSGAIVGMRTGLFGKNRVVFDRVMEVEGTEVRQTRPLWCNAFLFEAVAGTFYTENTVKASNGYWISRLDFPTVFPSSGICFSGTGRKLLDVAETP